MRGCHALCLQLRAEPAGTIIRRQIQFACLDPADANFKLQSHFLGERSILNFESIPFSCWFGKRARSRRHLCILAFEIGARRVPIFFLRRPGIFPFDSLWSRFEFPSILQRLCFALSLSLPWLRCASIQGKRSNPERDFEP